MNEEEGKNEGKEKLRKEKNKESAKGEGRTRSTEKQWSKFKIHSGWMHKDL